MNTRSREMVPVWREIHGQPDQVRTALATAAAQGRLTEAPRVAGRLDDGQVIVLAHLLEPAPRPPAYRRRIVLIPILSVALVSALAVVGYLLVWLPLTWIADHLTMIIGAAAVLLVLLGTLVSSGKCPGLHCPGCND